MEPILFHSIFDIINKIENMNSIFFLDKKIIQYKNIFSWKTFNEVSQNRSKNIISSEDKIFLNNCFIYDKKELNNKQKLIIIFFEKSDIINEIFIKSNKEIINSLPDNIEFWLLDEINPYKQNILKDIKDIDCCFYNQNCIIFCIDLDQIINYFINILNFVLMNQIYKNIIIYTNDLSKLNNLKKKLVVGSKTKVFIDKINIYKFKNILETRSDIYLPNMSLHQLNKILKGEKEYYRNNLKYIDILSKKLSKDNTTFYSIFYFITDMVNISYNHIDIYFEGNNITTLKLTDESKNIKYIIEGIKIKYNWVKMI